MSRFVSAAVAILTIAFMAVFMTAMPVDAGDSLTIPVDTAIYADPGSVIELGRVDVQTELAGPLCTWQASVMNQVSVHPGNDILIQSGGNTLVLSGVEDTAWSTTSSSGTAYLVDQVIVSLRMGPDGVFSGGLNIAIHYENCEPVPPTTEETTTTTEATTTTEEVTTTEEPTTTTEGEVVVKPQTITVASTTTTQAATSTTQAPIVETLPVTGSGWTTAFGLIGIGLIGAGLVLVRKTAEATL